MVFRWILSARARKQAAAQRRAPAAFVDTYRRGLSALREAPRGFRVFEEFRYDGGEHPEEYVDRECAFAARHLARLAPERILDVGSYRHFVLGLLAHYSVTTLDVRARKPSCERETVITGDAKRIDLPAGSMDAVVSLCAVEHFGLGRYGDELDLDADVSGMREMKRVLRPGGRLIFSTGITGASPAIAFNAHRIYDRAGIAALCEGLRVEEELFFSLRANAFVPESDLVTTPRGWDVYCGCWQKP